MRARYFGTVLIVLTPWVRLVGQTNGTVVIRGGSWLDVRDGRLVPNGAIVIRGGMVTSIVPPGRDWRRRTAPKSSMARGER
jgi:hypothetical protein